MHNELSWQGSVSAFLAIRPIMIIVSYIFLSCQYLVVTSWGHFHIDGSLFGFISMSTSHNQLAFDTDLNTMPKADAHHLYNCLSLKSISYKIHAHIFMLTKPFHLHWILWYYITCVNSIQHPPPSVKWASMHWILWYCVVLYCIVLNCAVLHYHIVPYCNLILPRMLHISSVQTFHYVVHFVWIQFWIQPWIQLNTAKVVLSSLWVRSISRGFYYFLNC